MAGQMAIEHPHIRPTEATVGRTFELLQRVATDRLRLLQLDLEERAETAARKTTFIGVGVVCLLVAWIGLLAAAAFALSEWVHPALSLLIVAGSQLLIGAGAILWARRGRGRRQRARS